MRHQIRLTDILAGTLVVLLLGAFGVAAGDRAAETQRRIQCAANMRQIGQAILLYSNENKGVYPRTIYDRKNPKPTWGTPYAAKNKDLGPNDKVDPFAPDGDDLKAYRPEPNDVTAALYMLMRTQDITSVAFVCPSSLRMRWDFGGGANNALHWTNWPGADALRDHLSYSYQNPYPTEDAVAKGFKLNNALPAEFAVLADLNPGTNALLKATPGTPENMIRQANSLNHFGDGQNVLYGDGHIEWQRTPFVGVNHDNIYTFGSNGEDVGVGGQGIVGSSTGAEDSVLLPTALDLKIVAADGKIDPKQEVASPSKDELKSLHEKLNGKYVDASQRQIEVASDRVIIPGVGTPKYSIDLVCGDRYGFVMKDKQGLPQTIVVELKADTLIIPSGVAAGYWKRQ
jgi:hypothetical protein